MSETKKAEFNETWQDETERLRDIRLEGFGPRRVEKDIDANIEDLCKELNEIQSKKVIYMREPKPDEREEHLNAFGVTPMDPIGIHYVAMREAGLPIRFLGTGASAESEGIYRSRSALTTGKSREIYLPSVPQSMVDEILHIENIATRATSKGALIENTIVSRSESMLLPQDLDPWRVADEAGTRLGISHDLHMEMIESGDLAKYFLTQHSLNSHSKSAMKWAAENEKFILEGKILENIHGATPYQALELAYTYFRLRRQEKIEPVSMNELLETQKDIYEEVMTGNFTT